MARYSVAPVNKAGVNTANTVMWELRSASTDRVYIREIGLFIVVAPTTAPSLVLARTTNTPAGATNLTPIGADPADAAASAVFSTAWATTAPTFTTAGPFIRNIGLPVTAGSGAIWSFADEPVVLAVSSGLCIANLNATGATLGSFGCYVVFDE
jgi:hypothetical protein